MTQATPILKLAEASDRFDVLRMAKDFHSFSPYSHMPLNVQKLEGIFDAYLAGDKTDLIIILGCIDGQKVGMVIGVCNTTPFCDDKIAAEIAWWVDPEYRTTRTGLLLFKAFEDWGLRIGAKYTEVTLTEGTTELDKFYTRSGYQKVETNYIKGIQDASI